MKLSKIISLMLVALAVVIFCVSCGGEQNATTGTTRPTTTRNPALANCDAGNHLVPDDAWEIVTEASCGRTGKKKGVCSVCGKEQEERIDKLPHTWGDVVTIEPTCLTEGKKYHECTVCDEKEDIEELEVTAHEYVTVDDVTGTYTHYSCSVCETSYVRNKPTDNDILYWGGSELDFLSLDSLDPNFSFTDIDFVQYKEENGFNTVIVNRSTKEFAGVHIKDNNLLIKSEESVVIQLDVMYESFPTETSLLLTMMPDGEFAGLVAITPDGYIGGVGEDFYETPIKDGKLELNTWYNIAVVLRFENAYVDEVGWNRLPYDIYLDGEKLAIETISLTTNQSTLFDNCAAGWHGSSVDEVANFVIRIGDFGRNNEASHYRMAMDNIRIYGGETVQPPMRGEIDFGDFKVTVDYPTEIKHKVQTEE